MRLFLIALLLSVFFFAALVTGWFRSYAIRSNLIDAPNERSSHLQPTPRGGGLSIVISVLIIVGVDWKFGNLRANHAIALLIPGFLVAGVGYLDDCRNVAALWRLLVHVIAAGVCVWLVDSIPPALFVVALVSITWMINLFNFMDGIDGIAAVEGLTVSGAVVALLLANDAGSMALVVTSVGAACAGFLVWNWPPAKIFMGDVGSGFLGFVLAGTALITHLYGSLRVHVWLILLGVFFVDATWTLLRRMFRGVRVYEAHRTHAYQKAARRFGHRRTTMSVAAINLFWLFPLAAFASAYRGWELLFIAVAWMPLFAMALKFGAGAADNG